MKKIFLALGAAAIVAGGLASCNNAGGNANATAEEKALGDSVATAFGEFGGAQALSSYDRMKAMQPEAAEKFNKDSYLKGVETVLNADTTDMAYIQGLQMGMQMIGAYIGINNEAKIPVEKAKLMEAFKSVYKADSVSDMNQYYANYQAVMTRVQAVMKAREDAAKAESPEAKKNLADGEAYAAKMVSEGYTKAPSGIVYKIDNPGAEPKVTETDQVSVMYVGKSIDGEVFDTNEGKVRPMRANGFVPGFQEALQMLGKGGKMTVVIPASLAYGLDGAGDAIGPNQTLVFDIEIQDINPAAN